MAWIQRGLGTGELGYNESDAIVHFVEEGMLIVTPRAFHLYLETNEWTGELGQAKDPMRALQSQLQKAGYLRFNAQAKSFFHWYRTQQPDGGAGATITTYLVENPQAYVRPVPAINPILARTEQPTKPTKPTKGE